MNSPIASGMCRTAQSAIEREIGMVGHAPSMLRIYDQIRRIAKSDSSVVIAGESGTGKELVATALHALSDRRGGAFVDVNIAAVPESLIESELFGHVKGSFTGATMDRMGCFEAADGGTLFIDEIGELKLHSQAKLLRTLETMRVRRVGACEDRKIDTRVVAATNRRLEEMVKEATFREDLYFRLNVMTIYLPPLRERPSDIPLLIDHLLTNLCARLGRSVPEIDSELMAYLKAHDWPGNVRQLKNCLESMLVMSSSERLGMEDLPPRLFLLKGRIEQAQIPIGMTLEQLERLAIEKALMHFNDDRGRAARMLGVSVRTLQRKLRQWASATLDTEYGRAPLEYSFDKQLHHG